MSELSELVVIYATVSLRLVSDEIQYLGKERDWCTMGQMSSVTQVHTEYGISWLTSSCVDAEIGCGTGERLDIGMVCMKEFLGSVDGELLDDVGVLLTSVVSATRVSFGVFVG